MQNLKTWTAVSIIAAILYCGTAQAQVPPNADHAEVLVPHDADHLPTAQNTGSITADAFFKDRKDLSELETAFRAEQWSRVIMLGDEKLKKNPDDPVLMKIIGYAYIMNNDFVRAEPILNKLVLRGQASDDIVVMNCLAKDAVKSEKTIPACLNAVERSPKNSALLYRVGTICERRQEYKKAAELYLSAWKLDPENLIYHTSATEMMAFLSQHRQAYENALAMIDSGSADFGVYVNAAIYADRAGLYEESVRMSDIGYEKFKDDAFRLTKAEALFDMKKYDESCALWNDIQKSNVAGMYSLRLNVGIGKCLLRKGDPASYDYLSKVIDTDYPKAFPLIYWYHGTSALLVKKFDIAQKSFGHLHRSNIKLHNKLGSMGLLASFVLQSVDTVRPGSDALVTLKMVRKTKEYAKLNQALTYHDVLLKAHPDFFEEKSFSSLDDFCTPAVVSSAVRAIDEFSVKGNSWYSCRSDVRSSSGTGNALWAVMICLAGLLAVLRRKSLKLQK